MKDIPHGRVSFAFGKKDAWGGSVAETKISHKFVALVRSLSPIRQSLRVWYQLKRTIMRTAAVLVFCLVALQCFSQNNEAIVLYDKGVEAFNRNDLQAAESFFTRSAKLEPHKDTYYNLAMVKDKLKDSCGYCVCLRKAGSYGDTEAKALYDDECETTDTVFY